LFSRGTALVKDESIATAAQVGTGAGQDSLADPSAALHNQVDKALELLMVLRAVSLVVLSAVFAEHRHFGTSAACNCLPSEFFFLFLSSPFSLCRSPAMALFFVGFILF
jgi:hypothetical protein